MQREQLCELHRPAALKPSSPAVLLTSTMHEDIDSAHPTEEMVYVFFCILIIE